MTALLQAKVMQGDRVIAVREVPEALLTTSSQTFTYSLTDGERMGLTDVDETPLDVVLAWEPGVVATAEVDEVTLSLYPPVLTVEPSVSDVSALVGNQSFAVPGAAASTHPFSLTLSSGTNRKVVVVLPVQSTTTCTGAKFNDVAMTQDLFLERVGGDIIKAYVFYYDVPDEWAPGTYTGSYSTAVDSTRFGVRAYELIGAARGGLAASSGAVTGNGPDLTVSLTAPSGAVLLGFAIQDSPSQSWTLTGDLGNEQEGNETEYTSVAGEAQAVTPGLKSATFTASEGTTGKMAFMVAYSGIVGSAPRVGVGAAPLTLGVNATGTVVGTGSTGTGSATIALGTAATGTVEWPVRTGTGTAALTLLTSGSGTVASNTRTGTGTAALALLTSGSGTVTTTTRTGTGSATLALLTSATGTVTTVTRTGTGAAAFALSTAGVGTVQVSGASGPVVLAVSASGAGLVNTTSILVPDSTVSQANWTITGAASVHAALATGDADFIQANIANATCRVGLSNPAVTFASLNAVTLRVRVQRP